MIDLSAVADELDALVRDGRRIRLGARNFEKPHAELDELLGRLQAVAKQVRALTEALPARVITGRDQLIVSVARPVAGRHFGPPSTPGPGADRRTLRVVTGPGDAA